MSMAAEERNLEPTEVITESAQLARGSFLELLKINAICMVPPMVLGFLATLLFVNNAESSVTVDPVTGAASVDSGGLLSGIGALVLVGLLFMLAGLFAMMASFTTVSAAYLGQHVGWKDALQRTVARGLSAVGMIALYALVTAGPYMFGFLLMIVSRPLGLLIVFAGFLWMVAALFLLSLTIPVWVVERCSAVDALKRSSVLVRAAASHVLIVGLLWFLVSIAIGIVVGIVGSIVGVVLAIIAGGLAAVAIQFFMSTAMSAWASAMLAVLYIDVRRRVDGVDRARIAVDMGFGGTNLGGAAAYAPEPVPPVGGPPPATAGYPQGFAPPPPPPGPGYAPPPPAPGGYAAPPQPAPAAYAPPPPATALPPVFDQQPATYADPAAPPAYQAPAPPAFQQPAPTAPPVAPPPAPPAAPAPPAPEKKEWRPPRI